MVAERKTAEDALADPDVKKKIGAQQKVLNDAEIALSNEKDETKKPALQKTRDAEQASLKGLTDNKAKLEDAVKKAVAAEEANKFALQASSAGLSANSAGSYAIGNAPTAGQPSDKAVEKIADAVNKIVQDVILQSFLDEECFAYLNDHKREETPSVKYCQAVLYVKNLEIRHQAMVNAGIPKDVIESVMKTQAQTPW